MRGIVGHLFRLCALSSLALFILVAALWILSKAYPSTIAIRTASSYVEGPSVKFIQADAQFGSLDLWFFVETNPSRERIPYTPAERAAYRASNEPAFVSTPRFRRLPIEYPFDPFEYGLPSSGVGRLIQWNSRNVDGSLIYRSNDDDFPGVYRLWSLKIALWPLATVFGLVGMGVSIRWRLLRRWRGKGLCLTCGYDLRASPTRCPECGTPAKRG
jgi:hypothetical protein